MAVAELNETQRKLIRMRNYALEGLGPKRVARLCVFCHPWMKLPKARSLWEEQAKHGDISIPNLRGLFEEAEKEYKLYDSFEDYLESLSHVLWGTFSEVGRYVNFRWSNEALYGVLLDKGVYEPS